MISTCSYSEQSHPRNITYPHMGTVSMGDILGGVRVSSKVSIQYWGVGYLTKQQLHRGRVLMGEYLKVLQGSCKAFSCKAFSVLKACVNHCAIRQTGSCLSWSPDSLETVQAALCVYSGAGCIFRNKNGVLSNSRPGGNILMDLDRVLKLAVEGSVQCPVAGCLAHEACLVEGGAGAQC